MELSSLDLSYTFEDDHWDEATRTHHPFLTQNRWIVDRDSTKEREWIEEPAEEDGKTWKKERYFDGTNTYKYSGYETEKKYKTAKEYYLHNKEARRSDQFHEGLNSFNIEGFGNESYRAWFFNKPYIYYRRSIIRTRPYL